MEVAEASSHNRRVQVGSPFVAYVESYAAACERLLPATEELALPTLCLQRHTIELLLKETLGVLMEAQGLVQLCDQFFHAGAQPPVTVPISDPATKGHHLKRLLDSLRDLSTALGLPTIPSALDEAVSVLLTVDDGQPDRLRYSTTRDGRSSFPAAFTRADAQAKLVPVERIGELVRLLVRAQREALLPSESNDTPETTALFAAAYRTYEDARASIVVELDSLESRTRCGPLSWTRWNPSAIDFRGHKLKALEHRNIESYKADCVNGSVFIFVRLAASSSEECGDEFLLSADSRGKVGKDYVDLYSFQSNLGNSVLASNASGSSGKKAL
jgi:hypothetical protein